MRNVRHDVHGLAGRREHETKVVLDLFRERRKLLVVLNEDKTDGHETIITETLLSALDLYIPISMSNHPYMR
jgi:hypothetical protein